MEIVPKKALGQHWLHDPVSLAAITDAADVQTSDVVLEIGAGLGTLSTELLKRGARVMAVEYDETLVNNLRNSFSSNPNFSITHADIRQFDFGILPEPYKLVSNIPYYLTAYLFRLLSDELTHKPTQSAILVQKEVAERICALAGQHSVLSLAVQYYYDTSLGSVIPAKLFTPPPKVDSQILCLQLRNHPLFSGTDDKQLFRIIKIGFSHRRKKLSSNLISGLKISRESIESIFNSAEILPTARAQQLSIEDWHHIYLALNRG
jgi:16S rRNA (adenine1518-N6/adenine1519-N6)-dimethyltransferase